MNNQSIGVFDSGVGGLSVLKKLQQKLPNESYIYLADSAYAPYGQLDESALEHRCQQIIEFMGQQNVKAIVIACNTATAAMADNFRQQLNVPIIGLEPAIKPASLLTNNRKIGVFATQNTLKSERYQTLIASYANSCQVFESPCLGFVEQVEKGELNSQKTRQLILDNLQPMVENDIDTLVLGCTHYPFLLAAITSISQQIGADLNIIDTATAVASRLENVLHENQLIAASGKYVTTATHDYYSTADTKDFEAIFSLLLQQPINLKQVMPE